MNVKEIEVELNNLVSLGRIKAWSNTGFHWEINLGPSYVGARDSLLMIEGYSGVEAWMLKNEMIQPKKLPEKVKEPELITEKSSEGSGAPSKKKPRKGSTLPDTVPGAESSEPQSPSA